MLRFFALFGRSSDLVALDEALRAAGLHPLLIPEPVKLTILRLLRRHGDGQDMAAAARLLAYCVLEHDGYVAIHGTAGAEAAEARVLAAMEQSETLDEKLILLALHAGVISEGMAARFDVEQDGG